VQTTTLPSSSPSTVASGSVAARRREDRNTPLFFPNGIDNGAPPFFPNRALLPPLDCMSSSPPPSSRFGPIATSSGATSLPCALRSTGNGVRRVRGHGAAVRRGAGQVWVQPLQAWRVALIHAKHSGAFVDEVLSSACGGAARRGRAGHGARFQPPPLHVRHPHLRHREGRGVRGEGRRAPIWA
jgi:hypothetical protein